MIEELQASPQLELEAAELDKELDNAEQHLARGVAMATEESDTDTVCNYFNCYRNFIGIFVNKHNRRYLTNKVQTHLSDHFCYFK